jgi:hypothetical protein
VTEYTYYLSWVHQQGGAMVFETATLTYDFPVSSLADIQQIQDSLRADGHHGATILGFSLLTTRTSS